MSDITIKAHDSVHMKIYCKDIQDAHDLVEFFSFEVEGAQFDIRFRKGWWDGKKRLYSMKDKKLYVGLLKYVVHYAETNGLSITVDPELLTDNSKTITSEQINDYAEHLGLETGGKSIKPRYFQSDAVAHVINNKRAIISSPTASGKSAIIYLLVRYYLSKIQSDKKILIIVPTASLVGQMLGDFDDYSLSSPWSAKDNCHCICKGANKHSDKRVIISTWQSIYKQDNDYFSQFEAVFGDEAHQFKAKNIGGIMEKLTNCDYRVGLTGTVGADKAKVNLLTLEGLFGGKFTTITTRELIDQGLAPELDINIVNLMYDVEDCKLVSEMDYQDEISFITENEQRNQTLVKLAKKFTKNSLFLFNKIEHGELLYKLMVEEFGDDRNVYLWHGGIDADQRNEDRKLIEQDHDAIIIASYGTTSTGVNIKNLHELVFASPTKSLVRLLQSVGRILRMCGDKNSVRVFDIVDNLKTKNYVNYAMKHYIERVAIYNKEKFDYCINRIKFKQTIN